MTTDDGLEGGGRRFLVGIDLGTTHCAMAYADGPSGASRVFPVPQLVAPSTLEEREVLPSFHYEPGDGEAGAGALDLPWGSSRGWVVGELARDWGASNPGRLVASAKSWLSHSGVDRTADLLPWHGLPEVGRKSPAAVSACYLEHLRSAWNHRHGDEPLEEQDVLVTVPASFDEIGRELTLEAARQAGLPRVVLIEEPLAAFYCWQRDSGSEGLADGQVILVCDVGGGTTDFTLLEVVSAADGHFRRRAVGPHLILGGDNLDLALAHHLESQLGESLDPGRWSVLVRQCQRAKETLLSDDAPETLALRLPGAGGRLVGGGRTLRLERDEARRVLLGGFLPEVSMGDRPSRRESGFREFGLPYAADPGITRYLAEFLSHAGLDTAPDAVLLNGGFFESPLLRERFLSILRGWRSGSGEMRVLLNARPALAVARGAVVYGQARRGSGRRVDAGLGHAYYLGVERPGGVAGAVCVAPASMQEGEVVDVPGRTFGLRIREPVEFPIYVSSRRLSDAVGDLVDVDLEEMTALPPIRTVVMGSGKKAGGGRIDVGLRVVLGETGLLEISCGELGGVRSWRLPFDVRSTTRGAGGGGGRFEVAEDGDVAVCAELIGRAFSGREGQPDGLTRRMEEALGSARWEWSVGLLRECWRLLMEAEAGRSIGPRFELRWLNLAGFCLRPGFGFPVDDWRVAQTWRLSHGGVVHPRQPDCAAEWWILWRRVAGGLDRRQQRSLAEPLFRVLGIGGRAGRKRRGGASLAPREEEEMWRLLGVLEWLKPESKVVLGEALLSRIRADGATGLSGAWLWALGRVGARVPVYGPLNTVLPPDVVTPWLEELAGRADVPCHSDGAFTLMQLARRTGDRYRDVSPQVRETVEMALEKAGSGMRWVRLVREEGALEADESERVLGDTLPAGLVLDG